MSKSKNGKRTEKEITSIGLVPLVIAEALALVNEVAEDQIALTTEDVAQMRLTLRESAAKLDSVLAFMFGDDCNLAALKLTDGQKEFVCYLLDRFAKGEEIEMAHTKPTVVSMV